MGKIFCDHLKINFESFMALILKINRYKLGN